MGLRVDGGGCYFGSCVDRIGRVRLNSGSGTIPSSASVEKSLEDTHLETVHLTIAFGAACSYSAHIWSITFFGFFN